MGIPRSKAISLLVISSSGWWWLNHVEKYQRMGRMTSHILWKNQKNVPNHQPVIWCLMISPWKKLHWNWPQHGLHFMVGLAVECSRLHRPRRKPCPALVAAMDPGDRFNPQNHWFQSGVGKCSNWTSPKYWGYNWYNHQQILESDVQNSPNRTFTNPCQY